VILEGRYVTGLVIITADSLDGDHEFLIGELHAREGIGSLICETNLLVLILSDLDIAQPSVRGL